MLQRRGYPAGICGCSSTHVRRPGESGLSNVKPFRGGKPGMPHSLEAEQAVLGGLLLDSTAWTRVVDIVRADDFHQGDHRVIFAAIATLAVAGTPGDIVTVSEWLERAGQLTVAGGLAYLGTLARDTPTAANIQAYAEIVREKAQQRRLLALGSDIERAVNEGATAEQIIKSLSGVLRRLEPDDGIGIELRHIADIVAERREPAWFDGLEKILERNVMAVIAGARGTFKSATALHWVMTATLNGHPAVILSAEGAGLDRRVDAWMRQHAPALELRDLPLLALERAVNLATTVASLVTAIEAAGMQPALVLVDTFSKYAPGLDENDNAAVAMYLATLNSGLRERFGCTVLLVAHAGHGDSKRPRGASVLMANPDAEYIVQRPDITAMTVTVSRERFKDAPSLPPLAYTAESIDLGRTDRFGEPITSIVMRSTDATAVSRPMLSGKNQKLLLAELERLIAEPGHIGIWTEGELREVGRGLGMGKQSARDAAHGLRSLGYLTHSIGGLALTHVPGQKVRNGAESQNSSRDVRAEKAEGSVRPSASARPLCPTSLPNGGGA